MRLTNMNKLLSICLALSLVPAAVAMDRAHSLELNQKAAELRKQKDWAGLLKVMIEIGHDLPGPTPRYLLRMASVQMHLGHTSEAVKWMEQYATMGLTYDVAADDDLAPLAKEETFKAVAAKMRESTKPIAKAELVCTLPLADMMPEDLAFETDSPKGGSTFVMSSIQHHTLYRVSLPPTDSTQCAISELPLPDDAKRWPTLAVSSDATRNLIWMTASAMPGFAGFPKEDGGKAELLAIDGKTGKVLRRFDPATGSAAVLGDMSVARDGTVYVSDSIGGGVYRVRGELTNSKLEKIAEGLFSPQTPALVRDGKRLFVADYPMGIAVVNLSRTSETPAHVKSPPQTPVRFEYLRHPANVAVTGLDGLYLYEDSLIGIQNGTEPARIIHYHLNHAQTEIVSAEVIEQSTERLGEPTHVVEAGGWFYITANVGWDKIDDSGKLKPGHQFSLPVLLRFRRNTNLPLR
jgi:hypothetical protein